MPNQDSDHCSTSDNSSDKSTPLNKPGFAGQKCQAPREGKICGAFISKFNPEKNVPFCQPCIARVMREEVHSKKKYRNLETIWEQLQRDRKIRSKNTNDFSPPNSPTSSSN